MSSKRRVRSTRSRRTYDAKVSPFWEACVGDRRSSAVGMMEGIPFRKHDFALLPGDYLFEYTDGMPEATDNNNELFGNDRMPDALNKDSDVSPEQALANVTAGISKFVGDTSNSTTPPCSACTTKVRRNGITAQPIAMLRALWAHPLRCVSACPFDRCPTPNREDTQSCVGWNADSRHRVHKMCHVMPFILIFR